MQIPALVDRVRRGVDRVRPVRLGELATTAPDELAAHLDELVHFRGWAHVSGWVHSPTRRVAGLACAFPGRRPVRIRYGAPSPDVADVHGPRAGRCRFAAALREPDAARARDLVLHVLFADGTHATVDDLVARRLAADPNNRLTGRFFDSLRDLEAGSAVLEIGSRARSGNVVTSLVPQGVDYVGFDIVPGDNVDVVGDAHALSTHFAPGSFDAAWSVSTYEHLAMPWKAAVELNRVLKPGATAMIASHQTWPVHEEPWDFWRFSTWSWPALFNRRTGFEVVDVAMGEPASIVARVLHAPSTGLDAEPAWLATSVVVRKVGEADVGWDVDVADVTSAGYPV